MQKFNGLKKQMKKNGGFSLVELIIVIAILAVIAAIAVPNVLGALEKSKITRDISNAATIGHAVEELAADAAVDGVILTVGAGTAPDAVTYTDGAGTAHTIVDKFNGPIPTPSSDRYQGAFTVEILTAASGDNPEGSVVVTANSLEVYPNPAQ